MIEDHSDPTLNSAMLQILGSQTDKVSLDTLKHYKQKFVKDEKDIKLVKFFDEKIAAVEKQIKELKIKED